MTIVTFPVYKKLRAPCPTLHGTFFYTKPTFGDFAPTVQKDIQLCLDDIFGSLIITILKFDDHRLNYEYVPSLASYLDCHFPMSMRAFQYCPATKIILCTVQRVSLSLNRSLAFTSLRPCEVFFELFVIADTGTYCVELLLQLCPDWMGRYKEGVTRQRQPRCNLTLLPPM
jgi:hypothetical protein